MVVALLARRRDAARSACPRSSSRTRCWGAILVSAGRNRYGVAMRRGSRPAVITISLGLVACSFPGHATNDGGDDDRDGPVADAANDAASPPDAVTDGPLPPDARCVIGSIDACALGAPLPAQSLFGTIDTDLDPRCRDFQQPAGGAEACLIYAEGIAVPAASSLVASGTRPLVLASTQDIAIDGVIDVSSRRAGQLGAAADDGSCTVSQFPENDVGGAAGGAGGSLGGPGGNGGTGDTDTSLGLDGNAAPGVAGPTAGFAGFVRGGCRGSDGGDESGPGGNGGTGGSSGGAVWLAALGTVSVPGAIRATGAGGAGGEVQSGGGGGGSGGMILVEAAVIVVAGSVSANGGGGGQGGTRIGGTPVSGNPGADGDLGTTSAAGGDGAPGSLAGPGGAGSAGGTTSGGAGQSSSVGGGGGGGGAGIVRFVGPVSGSGTVSPPAS
jgi:hypothetical protein